MKLVKWVAACLVGLATIQPAAAQDYPNRVLTLVVPFAAGGPGDTIARIVAAAMSPHLGQQIIVENTLGAGGTIGTHRVAKATPDGYTILLMHVGQATSVSLYSKLPYDPVNDFEKIGLVTDVPMIIVARPDYPPADLKELIAFVKERGDKAMYAHSGVGSAAHLCGMVFQSATGTKPSVVPYKGGGPVLNDLMGGHIDFYCDPATGPTPLVQSGKLKAYAVTTRTRLKTLPNLPTTAEAGAPDIEVSTWYGLYAPRGTPKPIVGKLEAALQSALQDPSVVQRFAELSMEPVSQDRATSAALDAFLKAEVAKWATIIKAAGVQPE
ncbi:MAG TPA: tripartite tricarboxylate transporter substrate-binding protein [Hyphomicrobiaceae bacterium]|nr:tripartite tricarboxylate transporter substrate-binding protein [Hyphomicrobiaceae bacterium]